MTGRGTVVLSTLEFDVLWERERLPRKHEALGVPSPGKTHTERATLVADAIERAASTAAWPTASAPSPSSPTSSACSRTRRSASTAGSGPTTGSPRSP